MSTFGKCLLFCAIFSVYANSPPVCTPDMAMVSVKEDAAINYSLVIPTCSDSDAGADGLISYDVTSGNGGGEFNVHPSTGEVTLTAGLDYETTTSHTLELLVKDGGSPSLSSNFTVYIQVSGENEFDPQITPPSFTDRDETYLGYIGQIAATDADAGPDGELWYAIASGNVDKLFHIDRNTGEVFVVKPLDYETVPSHTLDIEVSDSSPTAPRLSNTSVTLQLKNVNEHPPVCQSFIYKSISENSPNNRAKGLIVNIKPTCSDIDTGYLSYPYFFFNDPVDDYAKFRVGLQQGKLTLNFPIDPDTEKSVYFQEYRVRDLKFLPARWTRVGVMLVITGVDDNPTVWPSTDMKEEISEAFEPGATVIMTLNATDGDRPDTKAGDISYGIESQTNPGQFYVHIHGDIHLILPLDREGDAEIVLTVYAVTSAKPNIKVFANVTFSVLDVNDNAPTFITPVYWGQINEGTDYSVTPILTMSAKDPDAGANGTVTFSITDGDPGGIFSIDANTGVITSSLMFDFETTVHYELTITAQDGDTTPLNSTTLVVFDVSPLNEFDPVVNGNLTFTVSEGVAIGSALFTLNSTDADAGADGELWYSWSTDVHPFMIHRYTGEITLIGALDREAADQHVFEIVIYDSSDTTPRSSTATLTVVVEDENDNHPFCEPARYADISGFDGAGMEVVNLECSDADLGQNAALRYNIVSGNINGDLTVDNNGTITLASSPSTVKYDLEVFVEDSGISPLNMTVIVSVYVRLSPPLINLPTTISYPENTTVATVLLEVNSTALGIVSYDIPSGNEEAKFAIGRASGKLYLASILNKEVKESYSLTIQATDLSLGLSSTGNVTVIVEDINDNTPTFANSFYSIPVTEDVVNGTEIVDLDVTDADVDAVNKQITFLIASGNGDGKFSIDGDGKVSVVVPLDHEAEVAYSLVIEAVNNAPTGSLTGATTVNIEVLNQDEYPTVFNFTGTKYETSLPENSPLGGVILQVHADDLDMEALTYALHSGDNTLFHVDPTNGKIHLMKTLDRELQDVHQFIVSAQSSSGSSSTATVEIQVSDVNDNDPVFSAGVYTSSVAEAVTVASTVLTLNSTDPDIGLNANITYSIVDGNAAGHFKVENSEILTDSTLDYNSINFYQLIIQASDQGIPQRSTSTVVMINVVLDPAPPKFSPNIDSTNLPENTVPGVEVYDADATTFGAKESSSGTLRYMIFSGNTGDTFVINEDSGKVFLAGPVDAEGALPVHSLQIVAVNTIDASLVDNLTLTVTISDVNDNHPSFVQGQYTASVPHGSSIGMSVLTVSATDLDSGTNEVVSYSLSGDGSADFSINPSTGQIDVASTMDYFSKDRYILTVAAVDGGLPSLTSSVVVVVNVELNQNNAPSFSSPTFFTIVSEGSAMGLAIFQVIAIDQDVGVNGVLNYSLSSGNSDGRFAIDPTSGSITIDSSLDREDIASYNLEIECMDGGTPPLSSTAVLAVIVLDDNDNPPLFNASSYAAMVHKDVGVGFKVTTVEASDRDIGYNSLVTYSIISGNAANLFLMNPYSGEVSIQETLTAAVGNHVLIIEAKDLGRTPMSSNVALTITVLAGSNYIFSVLENQGVNTFVGTVTEPGSVTFSLIAGDLDGDFSIDVGTGDIRTRRILDREDMPEYHLTVGVEETANPSNWYSLLVTVTIDDQNDNGPVFTADDYTVSIVEGSPAGFVVLKLPVSDADEGPNAQIDLEIVDSVSKAVFDVSSSTFELLLKTPPSYDTKRSYNVIVKATDNGLPKKSKISTVHVHIVEVAATSTAIPVGSGEAMYVSLECSHTDTSGTVIHMLTGDSFGFNTSGLLSLQYITLQTESSPFMVGTTNGEIKVSNTDLLYKKSKYIFWIVAKAVFTDASEESRQGIVRIDTFDPSDRVIKIVMDIPKGDLQGDGEPESFLSDLKTTISSGRVGIWKSEVDSRATSRRRLLAQGTIVFIYAIISLDTDSLSGINSPKAFFSDSELLALLQASSDGTPVAALTTGAFSNYTIIYVLDEIVEPTPEKAWQETTAGIAIISMICIGLLVLIILLLLYFICTRSGKKQRTQPRGLSFNKSEGDIIDDTTMEKPLFPTSRSPPPPYESRPMTKRRKAEIIDGVAYDGRSWDESQRKISGTSNRAPTAKQTSMPHDSGMSMEGNSDLGSIDSIRTTSTLQLPALTTEDVKSECVLTRPYGGDPNARLSRQKNTSIGSGLNVEVNLDIPITPVLSHKQLESTL